MKNGLHNDVPVYATLARKCGKTLTLVEQILKTMEEGRQVIVYKKHKHWEENNSC